MPGFRSYVSPSREGILSDNPDDGRHDRVDPFGKGSSAGAVKTPPLSGLSGEERPEDAIPVPSGEEGSSRPSAGADDGVRLDLGAEDGEAPAREKKEKFLGIFPRLSPMAIAAAVLVNILLVLLFAWIMSMDRGQKEPEVYYIDLVARPEAGDRDAGQPGSQSGDK